MTAQLASNDDANLILRLYELRTDPVMREARGWAIDLFWPRTAQEVLDVFADRGSQENQFLRQVTSYWEMAAAFVLHGALSEELFIECNTEPFYLFAKFQPLLGGIRERRPGFLEKTGELITRSPRARAKFETYVQRLAARSPQNALS